MKEFAYGTKIAVSIETDPDELVSEIKDKIHQKTKVERAHMDLYINKYGNYELMVDSNSLGFYEVQANHHLMLKNDFLA